MSKSVDRRSFLKKTTAAAAGAGALAMSLEEKTLLARPAEGKPVPRPKAEGAKLPQGKIGDLKISRVICGGNLIGGYAHSRDLVYVSPLLKHYFTDDKIMETLEVCERNGVNTIITGAGSGPIMNRYWNERGGKIQWIAQCNSKPEDVGGDAQKAVDQGASAAFLLGNVADKWSRSGQVDLIGKFIESVKETGVPAGSAGHNLRTPMAIEKAGFAPDFHMKTLHRTDYWSARKPDQTEDVIDNYRTDNYWDKDPEKTAAFMKTVKRPWIAYKVLAAGAIHPRDGFRFAFESGADFLCVGMFDFQITEDALIAKKILNDKNLSRQRSWMA